MAPHVDELMHLLQQQLDDAAVLGAAEKEKEIESARLQEKLAEHYNRLLSQQQQLLVEQVSETACVGGGGDGGTTTFRKTNTSVYLPSPLHSDGYETAAMTQRTVVSSPYRQPSSIYRDPSPIGYVNTDAQVYNPDSRVFDGPVRSATPVNYPSQRSPARDPLMPDEWRSPSADPFVWQDTRHPPPTLSDGPSSRDRYVPSKRHRRESRGEHAAEPLPALHHQSNHNANYLSTSSGGGGGGGNPARPTARAFPHSTQRTPSPAFGTTMAAAWGRSGDPLTSPSPGVSHVPLSRGSGTAQAAGGHPSGGWVAGGYAEAPQEPGRPMPLGKPDPGRSVVNGTGGVERAVPGGDRTPIQRRGDNSTTGAADFNNNSGHGGSAQGPQGRVDASVRSMTSPAGPTAKVHRTSPPPPQQQGTPYRGHGAGAPALRAGPGQLTQELLEQNARRYIEAACRSRGDHTAMVLLRHERRVAAIRAAIVAGLAAAAGVAAASDGPSLATLLAHDALLGESASSPSALSKSKSLLGETSLSSQARQLTSSRSQSKDRLRRTATSDLGVPTATYQRALKRAEDIAAAEELKKAETAKKPKKKQPPKAAASDSDKLGASVSMSRGDLASSVATLPEERASAPPQPEAKPPMPAAQAQCDSDSFITGVSHKPETTSLFETQPQLTPPALELRHVPEPPNWQHVALPAQPSFAPKQHQHPGTPSQREAKVQLRPSTPSPEKEPGTRSPPPPSFAAQKPSHPGAVLRVLSGDYAGAKGTVVGYEEGFVLLSLSTVHYAGEAPGKRTAVVVLEHPHNLQRCDDADRRSLRSNSEGRSRGLDPPPATPEKSWFSNDGDSPGGSSSVLTTAVPPVPYPHAPVANPQYASPTQSSHRRTCTAPVRTPSAKPRKLVPSAPISARLADRTKCSRNHGEPPFEDPEQEYMFIRESGFTTLFNGSNDVTLASLHAFIASPPRAAARDGDSVVSSGTAQQVRPRMTKSAVLRAEIGREARAANEGDRLEPKKYYTSREMIRRGADADGEESAAAALPSPAEPEPTARGDFVYLPEKRAGSGSRRRNPQRDGTASPVPKLGLHEARGGSSGRGQRSGSRGDSPPAVKKAALPAVLPAVLPLGTVARRASRDDPAQAPAAGRRSASEIVVAQALSPSVSPRGRPRSPPGGSAKAKRTPPCPARTPNPTPAPSGHKPRALSPPSRAWSRLTGYTGYSECTRDSPSPRGDEYDEYMADCLSDHEHRTRLLSVSAERGRSSYGGLAAVLEGEAARRVLLATEEASVRALGQEREAEHVEFLIEKAEQRAAVARRETARRRQLERDEAEARAVSGLAAHGSPRRVSYGRNNSRSVSVGGSAAMHPLVFEHKLQLLLIQEQASRHSIRRAQQVARTEYRKQKEAHLPAASSASPIHNLHRPSPEPFRLSINTQLVHNQQHLSNADSYSPNHGDAVSHSPPHRSLGLRTSPRRLWDHASSGTFDAQPRAASRPAEQQREEFGLLSRGGKGRQSYVTERGVIPDVQEEEWPEREKPSRRPAAVATARRSFFDHGDGFGPSLGSQYYAGTRSDSSSASSGGGGGGGGLARALDGDFERKVKSSRSKCTGLVLAPAARQALSNVSSALLSDLDARAPLAGAQRDGVDTENASLRAQVARLHRENKRKEAELLRLRSASRSVEKSDDGRASADDEADARRQQQQQQQHRAQARVKSAQAALDQAHAFTKPAAAASPATMAAAQKAATPKPGPKQQAAAKPEAKAPPKTKPQSEAKAPTKVKPQPEAKSPPKTKPQSEAKAAATAAASASRPAAPAEKEAEPQATEAVGPAPTDEEAPSRGKNPPAAEDLLGALDRKAHGGAGTAEEQPPAEAEGPGGAPEESERATASSKQRVEAEPSAAAEERQGSIQAAANDEEDESNATDTSSESDIGFASVSDQDDDSNERAKEEKAAQEKREQEKRDEELRKQKQREEDARKKEAERVEKEREKERIRAIREAEKEADRARREQEKKEDAERKAKERAEQEEQKRKEREREEKLHRVLQEEERKKKEADSAEGKAKASKEGLKALIKPTPPHSVNFHRDWYAKWSSTRSRYYFVRSDVRVWEVPADLAVLPCSGGPYDVKTVPVGLLVPDAPVPSTISGPSTGSNVS
eukprot:gene23079-35364_t